MPLRPITSEFENAALLGRIAELERKLARIEQAITVGVAGEITVNSPMITLNTAMSTFSGVVQCDTIIANTVVGSSYTPGAGNVM